MKRTSVTDRSGAFRHTDCKSPCIGFLALDLQIPVPVQAQDGQAGQDRLSPAEAAAGDQDPVKGMAFRRRPAGIIKAGILQKIEMVPRGSRLQAAGRLQRTFRVPACRQIQKALLEGSFLHQKEPHSR